MATRKEKLPSNRNFGLVFFVFFLIIGLWPLLGTNEIRYWSIFFSIIFFLLGITNSKLLNPLNKIWFNFGILLGKMISPLVMGIIFFLVVTPIGVIMCGCDRNNIEARGRKIQILPLGFFQNRPHAGQQRQFGIGVGKRECNRARARGDSAGYFGP